MYYFYKDKKLTKFDDNVIVVSDTDIDGEFCLDETGYHLLNVLDEKPVLDGDLLRVGKSSIATYNKKAPNIVYDSVWDTEININVLSNACKFAAKNANYKPVLMGVCVADNGSVIATDGFKLYTYKYHEYTKSTILSVELINELSKYSGTYTLHVNTNFAWVNINGTIIGGKLLIGTFPDISKLSDYVGNEYDTPDYLSNLLDKASLTGGDVVRFDNGEFSITTETAKFCKNIDLPIISSFYLEHLKIAVKSVLNGKIKYKDAFTPLIIYDNEIRCVILPCKA